MFQLTPGIAVGKNDISHIQIPEHHKLALKRSCLVSGFS